MNPRVWPDESDCLISLVLLLPVVRPVRQKLVADCMVCCTPADRLLENAKTIRANAGVACSGTSISIEGMVTIGLVWAV